MDTSRAAPRERLFPKFEARRWVVWETSSSCVPISGTSLAPGPDVGRRCTTGWCGHVHASTGASNASTGEHLQNYFSAHQWVLQQCCFSCLSSLPILVMSSITDAPEPAFPTAHPSSTAGVPVFKGVPFTTSKGPLSSSVPNGWVK